MWDSMSAVGTCVQRVSQAFAVFSNGGPCVVLLLVGTCATATVVCSGAEVVGVGFSLVGSGWICVRLDAGAWVPAVLGSTLVCASFTAFRAGPWSD